MIMYIILQLIQQIGSLLSRQLKLVLAWIVMYQDELMQDWELVYRHKASRHASRTGFIYGYS